MTDPLNTLIIFLGGGIIGAGIHYASKAKTEKKKRHSTYVDEQLDRLYGPLYFLSSQNEKLFELSRDILIAHSEHFDGGKWSQDDRMQKVLREESKETIELSNTYAGQVIENNAAIVVLLRANYALADTDDMDLFSTFAIHVLRMNKEIKEKRIEKIPFNVYKAVGDISYSRPEFLKRVNDQFHAKKEVLATYH